MVRNSLLRGDEASDRLAGLRPSLLLAVALLYVWLLSIARRLYFTQAAKSLTARPIFQRYGRFQFARRWIAKQLTLGRSLIPDALFSPWRLI